MRAAVVLVIALTSAAHANPPGLTPPGLEEPPPPPNAQPPAPSNQPAQSYRTMTFAADAAAVGMLFLAIDNENEDLAKLSLGTYLFGAPLVHVVKNRPSRALASLGLRVGLPILGGMLGEAMHEEPECYEYDYCGDYYEGPSDEAVLGIVGGALAAMVIDTAYLAKVDPPKREQPSWTPTARATKGGFALGVNGRF